LGACSGSLVSASGGGEKITLSQVGFLSGPDPRAGFERGVAPHGSKTKDLQYGQGSQFTSKEWICELQNQGIKISMDGRGRWMDNVFNERLWRSLKYEKLRLWSYRTISEIRTLPADWIEFYNHRRMHQAHGYITPWSVY
jgi:putative transposase